MRAEIPETGSPRRACGVERSGHRRPPDWTTLAARSREKHSKRSKRASAWLARVVLPTLIVGLGSPGAFRSPALAAERAPAPAESSAHASSGAADDPGATDGGPCWDENLNEVCDSFEDVDGDQECSPADCGKSNLVPPGAPLTYRDNGGYFSTPVVDPADGTVYVGSRNRCLYAFKPTPVLCPKGAPAHRYRDEPTRECNPDERPDPAKPVRACDCVCLDPATPRPASNPVSPPFCQASGVGGWVKATGGVIISSPALAECTKGKETTACVVVGSNDKKVHAFARADGAPAWKEPFATRGVVESSPTVDPGTGRIYVGSHDGKLRALTKEGADAWEPKEKGKEGCTIGQQIKFDPLLLPRGTPSDGARPDDERPDERPRIIVGSEGGGLRRIVDEGEGCTIAETYDENRVYRIGAAHRADGEGPGTVYAAGKSGKGPDVLVALPADFASCKTDCPKNWAFEGRHFYRSAPALSQDGNTVYKTDRDAHRIHALNAATGEPKWSCGTGSNIVTTPRAVTDDFGRNLVLYGSTDNRTGFQAVVDGPSGPELCAQLPAKVNPGRQCTGSGPNPACRLWYFDRSGIRKPFRSTAAVSKKDRTVYVGDEGQDAKQGTFWALDLYHGGVRWSYPVARDIGPGLSCHKADS